MNAKLKNTIVSAAMKIVVGHDEIVVPSPRHCDQTARSLVLMIGSALLLKYPSLSEDDARNLHHNSEQGFIDKHGVFHSRTAAWIIAFDAGQVKFRVGGDETDGGTLYSENLY